MTAPEYITKDGYRALVCHSEDHARRVRAGFIAAGKSKGNIRVEEKHDWEGRYWVVIVN